MASREVTYNGTTFTIDGVDGMSEEQQKQKAIEVYNKKTKPSNVKGFLSSALNGLTFNMGDRVWGGLKAAVNTWGDAYNPNRTKEESNRIAGEAYEGGRKDFKEVNDLYKQKHKVGNFTGELIGSVPTMFIPGLKAAGTASKGLTLAKIGRGATAGAVAGGLYSAGASASQKEDLGEEGALKDVAKSGLVGAAVGAPLGAASVVASDVASRAFGKLRKIGQKEQIAEAFKEIGEDNIKKSIDKNTPIAALKDDAVVPMIESIDASGTPQARMKIKKLDSKIRNNQNLLFANENDRLFGEKSLEQVRDKFNADRRKVVNSLYEKATSQEPISTIGMTPEAAAHEETLSVLTKEIDGIKKNLATPGALEAAGKQAPEVRLALYKELETLNTKAAAEKAALQQHDLLKNPHIEDYLRKAEKSAPDLKNLADNNPKKLIRAAQMMGRTIDHAKGAGRGSADPNALYDLEQAYHPLKDLLRNRVDGYIEADNAYKAMKVVPERIIELGKDFHRLSTQELAELKGLVASNPDYKYVLDAAIKDSNLNRFANIQSDKGNKLKKIFSDETSRRLESFGYEVTPETRAAMNILDNVGEGFGGSATARKQSKVVQEIATAVRSGNFKKYMTNYIGELGKDQREKALNHIAEAVTNPRALKRLEKAVGKPNTPTKARALLKKIIKTPTPAGQIVHADRYIKGDN